jgi:hypothetical protein
MMTEDDRLAASQRKAAGFSRRPHRGFKIDELAAKVRALAHFSEDCYSTSNAAYDLRKLRGKGFVDKVPKSRRYSVTSAGLQAMAAL